MFGSMGPSMNTSSLHPTLQNMKLTFFLFVGHFCLLDPDTDSESGSETLAHDYLDLALSDQEKD
jgi:hypothetical protein